jgi:hypothetical protein
LCFFHLNRMEENKGTKSQSLHTTRRFVPLRVLKKYDRLHIADHPDQIVSHNRYQHSKKDVS